MTADTVARKRNMPRHRAVRDDAMLVAEAARDAAKVAEVARDAAVRAAGVWVKVAELADEFDQADASAAAVQAAVDWVIVMRAAEQAVAKTADGTIVPDATDAP
jgi:hypothetical protein